MRTIVITGGAGFIGSHVVRLFVNKYPDYHIINLDKLTYAGNLANLKDVEGKANYEFVKMDICDFDAFYRLMQEKKVDGIIHLAACRCCRPPSSTGSRFPSGMRASASTTSPPTRCTAPWSSPTPTV